MNSFFTIISKEGKTILVPEDNELLKIGVFNNLCFKNIIPIEYNVLYNLIYFKFEMLSYSYEDMINHINSTLQYCYEKHDEECEKYLKKILMNHKDLYYHKYHIEIFFEENSIDFISDNYLEIDSFINMIKNQKDLKEILINHKDLYYYKYHIEIFFEENSIDSILENYPEINAFINMIKNQKMKQSSNFMSFYGKHYENIILYDDIYLKEIGYDEEEENEIRRYNSCFYKDVAYNDILFYHVIKNKSLDISQAKNLIPYLNNKNFEFLLSNYDMLTHLNFSKIKYKNKVIIHFIKNYFNNGFKEEYKSLLNVSKNNENLFTNCFYVIIKNYKDHVNEFLNYTNIIHNDIKHYLIYFITNSYLFKYKMTNKIISNILDYDIVISDNLLFQFLKHSEQFSEVLLEKMIKNKEKINIFEFLLKNNICSYDRSRYCQKFNKDIFLYFLDKINFHQLKKESVFYLIIHELWDFFKFNNINLFKYGNNQLIYHFLFETYNDDLNYNKLFTNNIIPNEYIYFFIDFVVKKKKYNILYELLVCNLYKEYYIYIMNKIFLLENLQYILHYYHLFKCLIILNNDLEIIKYEIINNKIVNYNLSYKELFNKLNNDLKIINNEIVNYYSSYDEFFNELKISFDEKYNHNSSY